MTSQAFSREKTVAFQIPSAKGQVASNAGFAIFPNSVDLGSDVVALGGGVITRITGEGEFQANTSAILRVHDLAAIDGSLWARDYQVTGDTVIAYRAGVPDDTECVSEFLSVTTAPTPFDLSGSDWSDNTEIAVNNLRAIVTQFPWEGQVHCIHGMAIIVYLGGNMTVDGMIEVTYQPRMSGAARTLMQANHPEIPLFS